MTDKERIKALAELANILNEQIHRSEEYSCALIWKDEAERNYQENKQKIKQLAGEE